MKTLKDYISKAYHYTAPSGTQAGTIEQRERFIRYCEKFHLDEEFQKLVVEDSAWQELADKTQVYFFEDRFRGRVRNFKLPEISLIRTEHGTVPVIKILVDNLGALC